MLAVYSGRTMAVDTVVMWTSFLAGLFLSFCQVATAFRVYEGPTSLDNVLSKRDVEMPLIISAPSLVNNPATNGAGDVSRLSGLAAVGQLPPELDYIDADTPDYGYDELGFQEPVPGSSSGLAEALTAYYWPPQSEQQQQQQREGEDEDEVDAGISSVTKDDEDGGTEATLLPSRRKRYTDFQETALGICAGSCMYLERITYGECYDLCDWNGKTPSPWKKYEQQKRERQFEAQRAAVEATPLPANDPARVLSHRFGQRKGPRTAALTDSPTSTGSQGRRGKIRLTVERPTLSAGSDVQKLEAVAAAIVQNQNASGKTKTKIGRKKTSSAANTRNPITNSGCRS